MLYKAHRPLLCANKSHIRGVVAAAANKTAKWQRSGMRRSTSAVRRREREETAALGTGGGRGQRRVRLLAAELFK
jgi:hypothetical protein